MQKLPRLRYVKGYFTPDLGLGNGANYMEIEDGWATRQVDIFSDRDRWLCSACPDDYDEELELGGGMLCDQPIIIDDYEVSVLGESLLDSKFGPDWRTEVEEMNRGSIEISLDEFEQVWAEALRRCSSSAQDGPV